VPQPALLIVGGLTYEFGGRARGAEPAAAAQRTKPAESQLSRAQPALEKLWEEHLASEFKAKSAEAAINTMVEWPSVNHVPVMTGALRSLNVSGRRGHGLQGRISPLGAPAGSWRLRFAARCLRGGRGRTSKTPVKRT
jgi:hypothetical protein